MLQLRCNANFGEKPLGPNNRAEVRVQDLQRHAPIMARVTCQLDGRHAATTNLALDLVPASERLVELRDWFHASEGGETNNIRQSRRSCT